MQRPCCAARRFPRHFAASLRRAADLQNPRISPRQHCAEITQEGSLSLRRLWLDCSSIVFIWDLVRSDLQMASCAPAGRLFRHSQSYPLRRPATQCVEDSALWHSPTSGGALFKNKKLPSANFQLQCSLQFSVWIHRYNSKMLV